MIESVTFAFSAVDCRSSSEWIEPADFSETVEMSCDGIGNVIDGLPAQMLKCTATAGKHGVWSSLPSDCDRTYVLRIIDHDINTVNATLRVSPIAIVRDGGRRFRRREKMFIAKYLAHDTTFSRNFFTGSLLAMRRRIEENLEGVASRVLELWTRIFTHF
jgi:hypothetical protein